MGSLFDLRRKELGSEVCWAMASRKAVSELCEMTLEFENHFRCGSILAFGMSFDWYEAA
jgi:hypothetical protein